ncbi:PREDICTED: uncharacterized protein LOC107354032 [Acropora digitifera]|uniref:uncharacterized protein LOC107354032 n=1 Tax=Acropora digitifera TaxID=70779 RepID=UPI00077A188E|nr:PREDICTED: uncharacterized protein LOC107354032 [Acropora digitifera]
MAISMKAQQVTDLVRDSFPELRNADLTKIRVYKSFSRGSKMERVFSGIPDAKSIKETFNKPSSKRVYLYLKTDTPASPQHLTCVTNAASGSGDSIPPVSQPNRVSTVIIADNRTPQQQKPTLFLLWFQSNTTQSALLLQYQTCLFQRLDLTIPSH